MRVVDARGESEGLILAVVGGFWRIGSTLCDAIVVDGKHKLYRGIAIFAEKALEYANDELHRREVVIEPYVGPRFWSLLVGPS